MTGGAGYIGGITAKLFSEAGHDVTVFDNLSTGFKDNAADTEFIEGDLTKPEDLKKLFRDRKFDIVLHFAAKLQVEESVREPKMYFENNVVGSLNLIDASVKAGCNNFIFSSSATVYGDPDAVPIPETAKIQPINPYGYSKVMVEELLASYEKTHQLKWVALRYFNPVGAYKGIGPSPLVANLIPAALKAISSGKELSIYGNDYDTPDGTCINVVEIAQAHVLAADKLATGKPINGAINLGSGRGQTVLELLKILEKVSGQKVPQRIVGRRPGDPPRSVASHELARKLLAWTPDFDLESAVASAWRWHKARNS